MDSTITNDELRDLLEFMNSTAFRTRFMTPVHKIALGLRVKAVSEHGAQPSLGQDIASIEERIAWIIPFAKQTIEEREARERGELQSQRMNKGARA